MNGEPGQKMPGASYNIARLPGICKQRGNQISGKRSFAVVAATVAAIAVAAIAVVFISGGDFKHDREGVDHEIDRKSVHEHLVIFRKRPDRAGYQKKID